MASENIGVSDIEEVVIQYGPKRLTGFPSSGVIYTSSKQTPDEVTGLDGLDGEVVLKKRSSNITIAEVTLARSSRTNDYLFEQLELQRNAPGLPLQPFVFSHRITVMASGQAAIIGEPTDSVSDGEDTRTWRFICPFYKGFMGGMSVLPTDNP